MSNKREKEYWRKRFEQLEEAQSRKGAEYYDELQKIYQRTGQAVQDEIFKWYTRFAVNNQMNLQEARELLNSDELEEFRWNVLEYIKHGEENSINEQWAEQLENASARWHISRLEAIQIQMQNHVEVLYGNEYEDVHKLLERIYTDGYYHTAYEIQKGFGIGYSLMSIDTRRIEKVISKPWAADGINFSERIWKHKNLLINELHTNLTQAIIQGKNPKVVTDIIAERFKVSKGQAGRLVMTEAAYIASVSTKDAFKELDVEEYEILATLDKRTSDICQEMDGKHFHISQWEVGVTAPPFHVWCRSTTVPYFDDEFEYELVGERAARGEDGKTYYVPADMTYKQWKKAFVDGDKDGLAGLNKIKESDIDSVGGNLQKINLKAILENDIKSNKINIDTEQVSNFGNIKRLELGRIETKDSEIVADALNEQIRLATVENAIVIDTEGNVIHFESTASDSVQIFDVDVGDTIILHNHPDSNGILSFGEDDFNFLKEHQNVKLFRCCNSLYDYFVEVIDDISKFGYSNLWHEAMESFEQYNDEDMQHIVFEILNKKGCVKYERRKR